MWMPIKPGGLGHFAASEPCNGKNILDLEISNKASGQLNFQPTCNFLCHADPLLNSNVMRETRHPNLK